MGIKVGVSGVTREVGSVKCGVSGVFRMVTDGFCEINGVTCRFYGEIQPESEFTQILTVYAVDGVGKNVSKSVSITFKRYSDNMNIYTAHVETPRFYDTRGYTTGKMSLDYLPDDVTHGLMNIGTKIDYPQYEFQYYGPDYHNFSCPNIGLTGSNIIVVLVLR